jgi:hypothetical protein
MLAASSACLIAQGWVSRSTGKRWHGSLPSDLPSLPGEQCRRHFKASRLCGSAAISFDLVVISLEGMDPLHLILVEQQADDIRAVHPHRGAALCVHPWLFGSIVLEHTCLNDIERKIGYRVDPRTA